MIQKKSQSIIKILCSLLLLIPAAFSWQYSAPLQKVNPLPQVRALLAQEKYAEADNYLTFFMDFPYIRQNPVARQLHTLIREKRDSWRYKGSKLLEGIIQGNSDEPIGQISGIVTDYLIIGDIRDLSAQAIHWYNDEEVDNVSAALAGLSLISSGTQWIGGAATVGTAGAGTPLLVGSTTAKNALITLKDAHKIKKLPSWLGKTMIKAAKQAKTSKSLAGAVEIFSDINTLMQAKGGFKLLNQTRDNDSLKRMANFVKIFNDRSLTIYQLGGDMAVEMAENADDTQKTAIIRAVVYGQDGLKLLQQTGAAHFKAKAEHGEMHILCSGVLIAFACLIWLPWGKLIALTTRRKPLMLQSDKPTKK